MPQLPSFLLSPRLRLVLWGGLIVLTAVSIAELTVHVVRMVQAPLPPRLAAALDQTTPAAAPLQTSGTPTHYVLPTGGTAPLWRYDPAEQRYLPAAHLEPFAGVAVLDTPPRDGMVEVRVTDGQGFIDATRLAPGGAKAAHAAYCSYNAGPPLTPGEVLARHGNGDAALRIDNTTSEPVVLKLRDAQGTTALSVHAAQGATRIADLPPGRYTAEYATGTLWSRACGSFIAGERTWRLPAQVALNGEARITVPAASGHRDRTRCLLQRLKDRAMPYASPTTTCACTTRKPAAAPPSSSCTNTPPTTATGSRRCGISVSATAPSATPRAAIRRPMCPRRSNPTRRTVPLTTSSRCSIISALRRHISSACRWAASPRCISASVTPARARSLCVAGCGYGAEPGQRERFAAEAEAIAGFLRDNGIAAFAEKYAYGPTRVQFENRNPRGFAEFKRHLGGTLRARHDRTPSSAASGAGLRSTT